jgi:hypothetical protein
MRVKLDPNLIPEKDLREEYRLLAIAHSLPSLSEPETRHHLEARIGQSVPDALWEKVWRGLGGL